MPRQCVEKLERSHARTASIIEVLVEDIDRMVREVKDMKALTPVTKRRIGDERSGAVHDHTNRTDAAHAEIVLPEECERIGAM